MLSCTDLAHPFQTDPGVSQDERVLKILLEEAVKIDDRSLAELLNFFRQISRHIVYYDKQLLTSDWQAFFSNSIPFTLAEIVTYDSDRLTQKLEFYELLFKRGPSPAGLQLIVHFIFHQIFKNCHIWWKTLQGSSLPVHQRFLYIIRNQFSPAFKTFYRESYRASRHFSVVLPDFTELADSLVWGLNEEDRILATDIPPGPDRCLVITGIYNSIIGLLPGLLQAMKGLGKESENYLEFSMYPWLDKFKAMILLTKQDPEELSFEHAPHLGLLFAFLAIFRDLQDDLNRFSKKHLDFFYTQVLQIIPENETPDKAHILFTIQKNLKSYLLSKGLKVKGPKDDKKQDILFDLDDEIVINKASIADTRTLFLNHTENNDKSFVEGLYMAPDATKSDGIEKELKGENPSWPTVGTRLSKYKDPETKKQKAYPAARIGFILSSPVLFLSEGHRNIKIDLTWQWNVKCDGEYEFPKRSDINLENIFRTTYIIPENILELAENLRLDPTTTGALKEIMGYTMNPASYCSVERSMVPVYICKDRFEGMIKKDRDKLVPLFSIEEPFKILFTGADGWLEPNGEVRIDASGNSHLIIHCSIGADQPAIGFYDKEIHIEDLNISFPAVKVELNPDAKLDLIWLLNMEENPSPGNCCLKSDNIDNENTISYYHYLRNLEVTDAKIDVEVCELKNFIVQNEESVQDVNKPVYPFGTRPDVVDFTVIDDGSSEEGKEKPEKNLIGPNFYIGSEEIFCKKWNKAKININWKDRPSDFEEYYKAYILRSEMGVSPQDFGLDINEFRIKIAQLQEGNWNEEGGKKDRKLFETIPPEDLGTQALDGSDDKVCYHDEKYEQSIRLNSTDFNDQFFCIDKKEFTPLNVSTRNGFIKINLWNQDFLHKDYSFVLARQMMALGKYPDSILEGAVYQDKGNILIKFSGLGPDLMELFQEVAATKVNAETTNDEINLISANSIINGLIGSIIATIFPFYTGPSALDIVKTFINPTDIAAAIAFGTAEDAEKLANKLKEILGFFNSTGGLKEQLSVLIPNEPWTPIIKDISIDYTATATMGDIELVHLHPFQHTYQIVDFPCCTILPAFCDEGNLFLGIKELIPGSMVNVLFQLAETTADAESEKTEVTWHYLDNNVWKALRSGFEIVDDATENFTTSGIIKFALPENISDNNTIMPAGMHWVKASVKANSRAVCETIGIYTQAVFTTFAAQEESDLNRLANPLEKDTLSKLLVADANVSKVEQPFASFGGNPPEAGSSFYTRVSELLRHKNRSIQKWDYERICLEDFPQVYRVKCINHSFAMNANNFWNDYPMAPGYVILAVVPDIRRIQGEITTEPKVPSSLLISIEEHMRRLSSPFVRFRAMNPRYEQVNICVKLKLRPGRDKTYYKEKLKEDLTAYMAPWTLGKQEELVFGKVIYRGDMLNYLENREYIDFILELRIFHESQEVPASGSGPDRVIPVTPRSILTAGEIKVDVPDGECEDWLKDEQNINFIDPCFKE